MSPSHKPFIPKGISEIMDHLAMMMLESPTFIDRTGYFPHSNLELAFYELNEGLRLIRKTLGEERYLKLMEMSDRMRALFEADPEQKTGDTLKGCRIIEEMRDMLTQKARKS